MTLPGSGARSAPDDPVPAQQFRRITDFPVRVTLSPSLHPVKGLSPSGCPDPKGGSHLSTAPGASRTAQLSHNQTSDLSEPGVSLSSVGLCRVARLEQDERGSCRRATDECDRRSLHRCHRSVGVIWRLHRRLRTLR